MKVKIIVLLLVCVLFTATLAKKHKKEEHPKNETEHLNEEQKEKHAKILLPAIHFVRSVKALFSDALGLRKRIPKSENETPMVQAELNKMDTTKHCKVCKAFMGGLLKVADSKVAIKIASWIAVQICRIHQDKKVCKGAIGSFGETAYKAVTQRILDPLNVCAKIAMCKRERHVERLNEYAKEVLKDKPEVHVTVPKKQKTYHMMQMTDPHIDLEYATGTNAKCNEPLCCRAEYGKPKHPEDAAGYWGHLGPCDIPFRTFEQFLQFSATKLQVDMILWLGDNIAHDIWNQKQQTMLESTTQITNRIKHWFPKADVYPMFGNHEPYPADQFDFNTNSSQWLTKGVADMWKTWLDDKAYETLKALSYYAMVNKKYNLKVIALDMIACDTADFLLINNPTDPAHQLKWLREELYDAEKNNQAVFILGHIPPGHFVCESEWSGRFKALVDRFQNIIRGTFFGHTHSDQFQVIRSYDNKNAVGTVFIAPALTCFGSILPSFRIYEVDAETNVLLNYKQYKLDLNKWNKNTTGPIEWDLDYSFVEEYGMPDLTPGTFDKLVETFMSNSTALKTYSSHIHSGTGPGDLSQKSIHYMYCGSKNSVSLDAFHCLGHDASLGDKMAILQQIFPGQWAYDKC